MPHTSHVPSISTELTEPQPSSKVCLLLIVVAFGLGCLIVGWSNAGPVERARGVSVAPEVQVIAEMPISLLNSSLRSGQMVRVGQALAEIRDEAAWTRRNELQSELAEITNRVAERTDAYEAELNRRMAILDGAIHELQQSDGVLKVPSILAISSTTVGVPTQTKTKLQELELERLELPSKIRQEFELDQLITRQQACETALQEWERLSQPTPWTAPTGGIVAGVYAEPDTQLSAGTLFVTIRDTDHPKVQAEMRISRASSLEIGRRVNVRFSPDVERIGVVEAIDPGRRLAGTASLRDDPHYLTLTIAPAEEWPLIRHDDSVEISWCDTLRL